MSIAEPKIRITPEEFLRVPDSRSFELVNGELVERNMGWQASWISARVAYFLSAYCVPRHLGWIVDSEASYRCYPDDPDKVRRPDVSFVRIERLSEKEIPKGHCPIAPDLAVEVISPHDLYPEVEEKVDEYLRAGVRLVWVVNP